MASKKKQYKITESENEAAKLQKQNCLAEMKAMKPGHCNKYMIACIDPAILKTIPNSKILEELKNLQISYEITPQIIPWTITWKRMCQRTITNMQKDVEENFIVCIMTGEDLVVSIKTGNLLKKMYNITEKHTKKSVTLIVIGLVDYCKNNRGCIGRKETEYGLTEIQVFANVTHRLLEAAEEVGTYVSQLGKSIAEMPYKKMEFEKYGQETVYLGNEKKSCVAVENGFGLRKLYQAQLIKIPSVTLEIAEAIIENFHTVYELIEGFYHKGPLMLSDIPIRRAGGPITSAIRKIGPELSKKLHIVYTSKDPNQTLN